MLNGADEVQGIVSGKLALRCAVPEIDSMKNRKVNRNLTNLNRVVLLHGPPGSGKTSLCQVNSHSLFSKWFSEGGKLVMQMFNSEREIISDDSCFIILLIDEVESLSRSVEL
ncbi:hypothetical protein CHUAL_009612 [Chamberlinius hualienensis]